MHTTGFPPLNEIGLLAPAFFRSDQDRGSIWLSEGRRNYGCPS
jgi:hypothetical protein